MISLFFECVSSPNSRPTGWSKYSNRHALLAPRASSARKRLRWFPNTNVCSWADERPYLMSSRTMTNLRPRKTAGMRGRSALRLTATTQTLQTCFVWFLSRLFAFFFESVSEVLAGTLCLQIIEGWNGKTAVGPQKKLRSLLIKFILISSTGQASMPRGSPSNHHRWDTALVGQPNNKCPRANTLQ